MLTPPTVRPDDVKREQQRARRDDRYGAQEVLWRESTLKRVRACGRRLSKDNTQGVQMRVSLCEDGSLRGGFGGLQTCGGCWVCPVCASKIAATRQGEVTAAVARWREKGHAVVHATFTVRHRKSQRLKTVWDAVAAAWGSVTSGEAWVDTQADWGVVMPRTIRSGKNKGEVVESSRIGYCRVVEVTHGRNGWHVHVHVLLFVDAFALDEDSAALLVGSMFVRWSESLVGQGMGRPDELHGVTFRIVSDLEPDHVFGEYFTKHQYNGSAAAGAELAQGHAKQAKNGNRTPFQLLAGVYEQGDSDDLALWHEWERASKGRRQMTWSVGLRVYLDLGDERTDDEIAAEMDANSVEQGWVEQEDWTQICNRRERAQLRDAMELDVSGLEAWRWLDARGYRFTVPGLPHPLGNP